MDNNLGRMAAMDRRRNVRRAGHGPRPFGAPVMDRVLDADLICIKGDVRQCWERGLSVYGSPVNFSSPPCAPATAPEALQSPPRARRHVRAQDAAGRLPGIVRRFRRQPVRERSARRQRRSA